MTKADDTIPEEQYSPDVQKTVDMSDATYTKKVAYNIFGFAEYIGWALPGTAIDATGWRIKKLEYSDSRVTGEVWADGDTKFDNVWDNRAGLSYS